MLMLLLMLLLLRLLLLLIINEFHLRAVSKTGDQICGWVGSPHHVHQISPPVRAHLSPRLVLT